MQKVILLTFILVNLVHPANLPVQSSIVQVYDTQATYTFGEQIIFQARIQSLTPIDKVYINFQAEKDPLHTGQVTIDGQGNMLFVFDVKQQSVRPFTRVYYWFIGTLTSGESFTSSSFWFDYLDNRFSWQTAEDAVFRVHWYQGDMAFAQNALNTAHTGLEKIQTILPLIPPVPLDIFIYASSEELQSALQISSQSGVVGNASPEIGVVLVTVPSPSPETNLELERQIPHEMAHIMLYQATGPGYDNLPMWFNEGVASLSELYPNPDYQRTIDKANASNTLLNFKDLCDAFPQDLSQTYLAYAQSASFTSYIRTKYGIPKLQAAMEKFSQGMNCQDGTEQALGISLDDLQAQWKNDELKSQPAAAPTTATAAASPAPLSPSSSPMELLPYLIVIGLLVIFPISLSILRSIQRR